MRNTIDRSEWWSGLDELWQGALRESAGFDGDDDLSAPSESQLDRLLGVEVVRLNNQGVKSIEAVRPLRKLRVLDVGWSRVETIEPLSEHTELEQLDISVSRVVDLSPLAGLSKLRSLAIDSLDVTDLKVLAPLSALEELSVTSIAATSLSGVEQLPRLRFLNANASQVRDISALAHAPCLERVMLSWLDIPDLSPLAGAHALRVLELNQSGLGHVDLRGLERLETLELCASRLADPSVLKHLVGLRHLKFNETRLGDLSFARELKQLRTLNISGTDVVDLTPLGGCPELEKLDVRDSAVARFDGLEALSRLTELNAANTPVTDVTPLASCSALVKLHLEGTFVSDIDPLRALEHLEELNLSETFVRSLEPLHGGGLTWLNALGSDADEAELIAFARHNPDAEIEPSVDVDDDMPATTWQRPADLSSPRAWYTSLSGYHKYLMSNAVDVPEDDAASDADCEKMFELEELDLGQSEWFGDLSPLEPLKRLRVLRAGGAHVKRLDVLATLPLIEELDLGGCRARDLAPLGALERLRVLNLAKSPVQDLRPLAGARALETLNLEGTWVTSLAGLESLGGLRELNLTRSRLEDLAGIGGVKSLRSLSLRQTRVGDISRLSGLDELVELDLTQTPVVDLAPLAGLANLETLEFNSTQARDFSPLAKLTRLRKLTVSGSFDDATPLSRITTLEEFDASNSKLTSLNGLEAHPSLRELDIADTEVSDLTPLSGARELRTLTANNTPVADLTPLAGLESLAAVFLNDTLVQELGALHGLPHLDMVTVEDARVSYEEVKAFRAAQPKVDLQHDHLDEEEAELEQSMASAKRLQETPRPFGDVFEEFLGLVEKSTGVSRLDLGFRPPASEEEIAKMEAELRGDSDEDEWNERVGEHGLDDLKAMLRVANGHTKKFAFLAGPLLDTESVVSEYLEMLEYASDEVSSYKDDETLHEVNMHEYWIPFASYTAEVTFLIDLDPGPSGKRGQVLVNYGFEDKFVICDSLSELFRLVNQTLRDGTLKFGPIEGYEQKYDLLTPAGKQARLVELLCKLRGD